MCGFFYYRYDLQKTIVSTSNAAYLYATEIFKQLSFGEIPSRQFNAIRERVDSLLLDLCPEAVEKFTVAYERLASSSSEDWSHSLTAARRILKSVADSLYPPRETKKETRKLGEEPYINRLWAFLDEIIKRRVKTTFTSLDELTDFKEVGPKTVEKMRGYCVAY